MTELQWEQKLNIHTIGRDASQSDAYRYPYEPTDYAVLQRLADSGLLTKENVLVDYGCGKGRVSLFLNHVIGCRTIGVEYDGRVYGAALENLRSNGSRDVSFVCAGAEAYEIGEADSFYFFNPFSLEVLRSVYGRILEGYYRTLKRYRLYFYYPSDDYVSWLMTRQELQFVQKLDCRDLMPNSGEREQILVFELPAIGGSEE